MANQALEKEITQAVLDFITDGTYPNSEQVVSAEFPLSALSKELELLSLAKNQVEAEIRSLSRENSFDADDWISQAKQLHADLARSRLTAREIVAQHENTKPLQLKVEDATAKIWLIKKEIVFNQTVTNTLEEVQRLCQQLDTGRNLYKNGEVMAAIDTLEAASKAVNQDSFFKNTNVMGILLENVSLLRREITEFLRTRWSEQLQIDPKNGKLILSGIGGGALEETIAALARLDVLAQANDKFQKDLFLAIINPILLPSVDGLSHKIYVEESAISVDHKPSAASVSDIVDRFTKVLGFLHQSLPRSILDTLSSSFVPTLSSKIISCWLSSSIPTTLDGLRTFDDTLNQVREFAKTVESFGWHGQEELVSWVNQAPRLWLTRRRVDSLDQIRKVLAASQGTSHQVERVEKKQVSKLPEESVSDDWNAGWDNEKDNENQQHEDEDVRAWGLDDDTNSPADAAPDTNAPTEDDDAGDAWGWGDDEEDDKPASEHPHTKEQSKTETVNGSEPTGHGATQEVTLIEKYTITDIPDSILRVVQQQITDSETLSQPTQVHPLVASSGAALMALPTLILAMFKAIAPSFYELKLNAGRMYLYNDSLYLADQVRKIAEEHQLDRLNTDIESLDKFGKLAYSKEMQTQRIIVTDLLDGSQGFSQCSEQPFLRECENAVSAVVDRLQDVFNEWQPILSHSALLQSIGSLVSTVINKIIIDIEDLGDISESQSQNLVSFCNQLSKLEGLFLPESSDAAEAVPMTAVYVRNWLKFQYLVNILESSLADIKFLWQDGELSLEFTPDELVDLIEALFAESDYRRKTIADIRRVSRS